MKNSGIKAWAIGVTAAAALLLTGTPGFSQESSSNTALRSQIDLLKEQMQQMQHQIERLQTQAQRDEETSNAAAQAAARAEAKAPPANAPRVTESKTHRFGLSSADGANTIELTGRLHIDTADYFHYNPTPGMADKRLASGINVRRARIGVTGKFQNDWQYTLIYDLGGNSDSLNLNNALANGNSKTNTSTSNSAFSGVENALITYNGFYNGHQTFPVAIDFGVMDVPWTLQEATSSNDILFMERSSAQVVATAYGGGDSRTAFGVRSNDQNYFLAAYLTGPTTGALHTDGASCIGSSTAPCTLTPSGHGPQTSVLARGSYQFVLPGDIGLHIGANFGDLFRPRGTANAQTISLADRPELRVDPSQLLTTGNIPSTGGTVEGIEAAASWQSAFLEGEFFHYTIDQFAAGSKTLAFNGGYVEASYSLGGRRYYAPASGGYTGVLPDRALSLAPGGGWGALEITGRFSTINLNDGTTGAACSTTATVTVAVVNFCAGSQTVYSVGLNYYPNYNMKFMLEYEHGIVDIPSVIGGPNTKGATLDAIAARTQIMF
jgi:phosphate-selective porin OprO/OprP